MLDIHSNGLEYFGRGIESITHAHQTPDFSLPASTHAAPFDARERTQVEFLLHQPTLDHRLDAVLRPPLENREVLLPARFIAALAAARALVRQAALRQGARGAEASDPSRVLNRAARLLDEDAADRDLAQMYRSALYQG